MTRLLVAALAGLLVAPAAPAQPVAGRALKFELYKNAGGEFAWRLKAGNGEILATAGQGYKRKADAKAGVDRLIAGADGDKLTFELYEDKKDETRWRVKASNGQIVASSSQGYKRKADAEHAVALIKGGAKTATVDDQTEK